MWFGSGFVFSGFLTSISRGYSAFGDVVTWAIGAGLVLWIGNRVRLWVGARKLRPVRMVNAAELAARLEPNALT